MIFSSNEIDKALTAIETGDYSTAFAVLSVLAEQGNPKAQCNLATLYHCGWGTDPDGKKAAELWEAVGALNIAQEHLSAVAYHNLSVLYIVGAPGLIPNSEKAAKYDRLAKESGFALEANSDSPTPE